MIKTIAAIAAVATIMVATVPAHAWIIMNGGGTNGGGTNGGGTNGGGTNGTASGSSTLSVQGIELPASTR